MSASRRKSQLLAAALLLLLAVLPVYVLAIRNAPAGAYHDDGIYIATGQSLAAGQGYAVSTLPDRVIQTKYPPVLPILLSVLPPGVVALGSVFAACLFTGLLARREGCSPQMSLCLSAVLAFSIWSLGLGSRSLSECLFAALILACLYLLDSSIAASALLAGLAFLTRTVGLAVLPAVILALGVKGRYRDAFRFASISGFFVAAWVAFVAVNLQPTGGAERYYTAFSYLDNSLIRHSAGEIARVVLWNAAGLLLSLPNLLNITGELCWIPALLLAGMTAIGLRRVRIEIATVVIAYCVLVCCTCGALGTRYAYPVWPVLLIAISKSLTRFRAGAATVALGIASIGFYRALPKVEAGLLPWSTASTSEIAELRSMAEWISGHTSPSDVLSANVDPYFALATRRKTIRLFNPDFYSLTYSGHPADALGTPDSLLADMGRHRVSYLLLAADTDYLESPVSHRLTAQMIAAHSERFELVYQGQSPHFRIYRLLPSTLAFRTALKPE